MPIYEYTCTSCEHRFEELVLGGGARLVACPQCTSADVRRLLSSFSAGSVGGDEPRRAGGGGGCCGGGCGCRR